MPDTRLRVGITGVDGLIGWHLRAFLHGEKDAVAVGAARFDFATPGKLAEFASKVDVLVHLAGMNRGDDVEIETTNVRLAESVIQACESTGSRPHIIFASSAHISRDTGYARSKRAATRLFEQWAQRSSGRFTALILPHVFGEGGKPFYNSAVSTFCHQLANDEEPRIIVDGTLELVHAQEVAWHVMRVARSGQTGSVIVSGEKMSVSELLRKLSTMNAHYGRQVMPDLRAPINLSLFNTLRSYWFPRRYPITPKLHSDNRGHLFEAVKSHNGGQSFISSTKPDIVRGNHYHRSKVERFLVIKGRAVIRLRRLFSDKVHMFQVSGDQPQYIDIPTLHAHNIENCGTDEVVTVFWSHEIFDPEKPDTFAEVV